MAGGIKHWPF